MPDAIPDRYLARELDRAVAVGVLKSWKRTNITGVRRYRLELADQGRTRLSYTAGMVAAFCLGVLATIEVIEGRGAA